MTSLSVAVQRASIGRLGSHLFDKDHFALPPRIQIARLIADNTRLKSQVASQSADIAALVTELSRVKQKQRWSAVPLSAEAVVEVVAEYFDIAPKILMEKNRQKPETDYRQIVCAVLREMTAWSLADIGRALHLDHSTVHHSVVRVRSRRAADPDYDADVVAIIAELDARVAADRGQMEAAE